MIALCSSHPFRLFIFSEDWSGTCGVLIYAHHPTEQAPEHLCILLSKVHASKWQMINYKCSGFWPRHVLNDSMSFNKNIRMTKISSIILISLISCWKAAAAHRQILQSEGARVPSVANHRPGNSGYKALSFLTHREEPGESPLIIKVICMYTPVYAFWGIREHTRGGKERFLSSFPLVNLRPQQRMSVPLKKTFSFLSFNEISLIHNIM